jgi:transposase-like protein
VLNLSKGGRKVTDVVRAVGVGRQTLYAWRRQERIDRG